MRGTLARAGFSSMLLLGMFLLSFSPALVVRALGLDTEVGYTRSPFATVPLYGQVEAYSQELVDNFIASCSRQGDPRACRCAIDAIRRRFTVEEYRAIEARLAKGEAPKEFVAAVDECRY